MTGRVLPTVMVRHAGIVTLASTGCTEKVGAQEKRRNVMLECPRCGDECDERDMSEVDKAIVCSECRFDAELEDLSRWEEELAEGAH